MGLRCVFSREPVSRPEGACEVDGSLNCHGYGSTVTVTATFGLVAAAQAIELLQHGSGQAPLQGQAEGLEAVAVLATDAGEGALEGALPAGGDRARRIGWSGSPRALACMPPLPNA